MQSKSRIYADPPDQFDQIPDPLILLILNNLADIRSLARLSSVSKKFHLLVPLVHDIHIKIDRLATTDPSNESHLLSSPKSRNLLSRLLHLLLLPFLKPFHHLRNPTTTATNPLHSPAQLLKNFTQIRNLRIELPSGDVDIGTDDGVLLRWHAEFGSALHNCVILGGTPSHRDVTDDDNGNIPESFFTNGGLKLRVVWTISSLIAASTRHFLLRPIIKNHPTLRSLVVTDSDGQGTLSMGAEQLREFREKPLAASSVSGNRTQVPASNMKLRYAPYVEMHDGVGMRGATLVAIRPSEGGGGGRKEAEEFVDGAFDGGFRDAVKMLVKRRTYLLEMNGF